MDTPDFRALCAALLKEVDALPFQYDWRGNAVGPLADFDCTVMESARAALEAVPAAEGGPTEQEVDELCCEHGFHYEDSQTLDILVDMIRDAVARYATPAPVPVVDSVTRDADEFFGKQLTVYSATAKVPTTNADPTWPPESLG